MTRITYLGNVSMSSLLALLLVLFGFNFSVASAQSFFGDSSNQLSGVGAVTADLQKAYWDFNGDSMQTVEDRSLKGNKGIINGNPKRVPGREGTALLFDGVDDYISVKDSSDLDITTRFTLSAWVRPDETRLGTVLSKNGSNADNKNGYVMSIHGNALEYGIQGKSPISASHPDIKPGAWTHVVVTYQSSSFPNTRLYINGERVHGQSTNTPIKNAYELLIGRGNDGSYFKGALDEVRIHQKAFLDSDIKRMYDAYGDIPFPEAPEVEPAEEPAVENPVPEPEAISESELADLFAQIAELLKLVEAMQTALIALQNR